MTARFLKLGVGVVLIGLFCAGCQKNDQPAATAPAPAAIRYSTDIYAQALGYRLGYEKFWELRHRAVKELGERFDMGQFHAAAIGEGAMPLDVLEEHINHYIAQQRR